MTYVFCVQSGVEFGGEQLRKERTVDPSVMVHTLYGVYCMAFRNFARITLESQCKES